MSKKNTHGSVLSYSVGFVISIILTLIAYVIVSEKYFDGWRLIFILFELAIFQLWIQVVFFLHLGRDAKSRWNLVSFLFMGLIILIVGIGSIWIMNNLHSYHDESGNQLSPQQTEEFLKLDEGYKD